MPETTLPSDADPFAMGGVQTDASSSSAGDEAILAAFQQWVEGVRATNRAAEFSKADDDRDTDRMVAIAEMAAAGAVGLAIKAFLALHAELCGTPTDAAALSSRRWTDAPGAFGNLIQMGLADDLVRFAPQLEPLLAGAIADGDRSLAAAEDDEGEPPAADPDLALGQSIPIFYATDRPRPCDLTPLADDAAFLDAEREIARLYCEKSALPAPGLENEDAVYGPYYARIDAIEDSIETSPPRSYVSAGVKLRRLLDPVVGMPIGENEGQLASLQQVLDFIEREAQRGGAL